MRLITLFTVCSACLLASEGGTKVDNDVVRIVEVDQAPHTARTIPGLETNLMLVFLSPGNIERTEADGRKSRRHWAAGQVLWIPAGESYDGENVGSALVRLIEIELKKRGVAKPAGRNPELDPIVIDPKHNILMLENEQVRAFRSWREPGATEKMHEHAGAGRVAVLLTDLNATVKVADGSTNPVRASSGDVLWSGAVTHATTNLSSKKFDMVVVEVK